MAGFLDYLVPGKTPDKKNNVGGRNPSKQEVKLGSGQLEKSREAISRRTRDIDAYVTEAQGKKKKKK